MLFLAFVPQIGLAQLDNEYFVADQLLRQQKYQQAFQKFNKLYQEQPNNYTYFNKTVECLINLKKYEQAISLAQQAVDQSSYQPRAKIRIGEIYYIAGKKKKAFSIWDNISNKYKKDQQVSLQLARTMSRRRAFDRAITVYNQLQQYHTSSNIISSELADTYLQAGKYEQAIREYLQLVKKSPNRLSFIQQRLIRFKDDYIYDVAILEISDFLKQLSPRHPSYRNLQQLEVWLLMERELYKRALATARKYEALSSNLTYLPFNIGRKLLAAQKFELAEKAYSYYIENQVHSLKYRSMEKLATIYRQWAKYLENYNLGLSSERNELYNKAITTLKSIKNQKPNYRRIDKVLVELSELALDVTHQPDTAAKYLEELRILSGKSLQAKIDYIEGRLHLYNQEYSRARIAFTKSNKQENTGLLAEESRYYLALTDFYSGDYEFAKIQLNALERQNTSYFANDAVQLRIWIQSGLNADSTGMQLRPFANAIEYFSQGKDQLAQNSLQDLFQESSYHPLIDDAILELSLHKTQGNIGFIYKTLSQYLSQYGAGSPLHERLLWERARLADQLVNNKELSSIQDETAGTPKTFGNNEKQVKLPTTVKQLFPIYEEILVHFPNGFYATYVRNRINELQNIQT
ncbi:tetratricopeptide repeat protein [Fodinibius saliphilus]|uniref:tetratricopeptide repeat protein n=1 Tax=Fodinibius saliphilus TaxID=1920650 RepID=UPI001FE51FF3|nr:tetratricopeptide repeat protein [Fodinibius saliphilus]